jgi:hypothetical protein
MPVRRLPSNPNLDHLKYQAKDLLKEHAVRSPEAAQQLREFHPRFLKASDAQIFAAPLRLSDAQLAIAREHGFASWTRLKAHVEKPMLAKRLNLPHHERIDDAIFRRAVELLDAGDVAGLRAHLIQHRNLVHQHVTFEGGNYFRNPTLLEFVAENPVRHGTMPAKIVEIAKVILDADAEPSARNEALMLISTGSVARESGKQDSLIDLLCDYGADPNTAIRATVLHGELGAANALLKRGAHIDLPVAAGLGRIEDVRRLLAGSNARSNLVGLNLTESNSARSSNDSKSSSESGSNTEDRHLALALASQYGHVEIVRVLLDAGEDPNRYNPIGGHSHSTPLHQAAAGHEDVVRLLVERGARLDLKDILWHATPADWAKHEGKTEIEAYLRSKMESEKAK